MAVFPGPGQTRCFNLSLALQRRPFCLAFVLGACVLPLMTVCGGKGGNPAKPSQPPAAIVIPEGVWSGQATYLDQSTAPIHGLVLADGRLGIFLSRGEQLFTGKLANGAAVAQVWDTVSMNPPAGGQITLTRVDPKASFSADAEDQWGAIKFAFDAHTPGYDTPLSKAEVVGNYVCVIPGSSYGFNTRLLTMNPDGALAITGGFAGTYTIPDETRGGISFEMTLPLNNGGVAKISGIGCRIPAGPGHPAPKLILIGAGPKAFAATFQKVSAQPLN